MSPGTGTTLSGSRRRGLRLARKYQKCRMVIITENAAIGRARIMQNVYFNKGRYNDDDDER